MIKYQIKKKEVTISDTCISYGKESLRFDEIIDFEFSHSYFNFSGGIELNLIGKKNRLLIYVSASNSVLQRKSTTKNVNKVEEIANYILPIAINGFVKDKYSELENGGIVKIWKLTFEKDTVKMRPRSSFWTKVIEVKYSRGTVIYENQGIGIFGSSGSGSCFYLNDLYENEFYKYSNSASAQPTQGEFLKIEGLFDFMKSISVKNSESKINLDFLK
ncbi:hypothetical protein [Cyclobacterium jeungdonense]|uniref:Uncharacterized protein n=1 Tax=Cyclobacterium jeungdonense TaxID=708087 RepID=A0ABT8C7V9_9BACT|nr:hypothetical protein [Cyclobacterium jeungdonense]MDN3688610.1 hypothetical protein [Cyclobacterium jeungdonense]